MAKRKIGDGRYDFSYDNPDHPTKKPAAETPQSDVKARERNSNNLYTEVEDQEIKPVSERIRSVPDNKKPGPIKDSKCGVQSWRKNTQEKKKATRKLREAIQKFDAPSKIPGLRLRRDTTPDSVTNASSDEGTIVHEPSSPLSDAYSGDTLIAESTEEKTPALEDETHTISDKQFSDEAFSKRETCAESLRQLWASIPKYITGLSLANTTTFETLLAKVLDPAQDKFDQLAALYRSETTSIGWISFTLRWLENALEALPSSAVVGETMSVLLSIQKVLNETPRKGNPPGISKSILPKQDEGSNYSGELQVSTSSAIAQLVAPHLKPKDCIDPLQYFWNVIKIETHGVDFDQNREQYLQILLQNVLIPSERLFAQLQGQYQSFKARLEWDVDSLLWFQEKLPNESGSLNETASSVDHYIMKILKVLQEDLPSQILDPINIFPEKPTNVEAVAPEDSEEISLTSAWKTVEPLLSPYVDLGSRKQENELPCEIKHHEVLQILLNENDSGLDEKLLTILKNHIQKNKIIPRLLDWDDESVLQNLLADLKDYIRKQKEEQIRKQKLLQSLTAEDFTLDEIPLRKLGAALKVLQSEALIYHTAIQEEDERITSKILELRRKLKTLDDESEENKVIMQTIFDLSQSNSERKIFISITGSLEFKLFGFNVETFESALFFLENAPGGTDYRETIEIILFICGCFRYRQPPWELEDSCKDSVYIQRNAGNEQEPGQTLRAEVINPFLPSAQRTLFDQLETIYSYDSIWNERHLSMHIHHLLRSAPVHKLNEIEQKCVQKAADATMNKNLPLKTRYCKLQSKVQYYAGIYPDRFRKNPLLSEQNIELKKILAAVDAESQSLVDCPQNELDEYFEILESTNFVPDTAKMVSAMFKFLEGRKSDIYVKRVLLGKSLEEMKSENIRSPQDYYMTMATAMARQIKKAIANAINPEFFAYKEEDLKDLKKAKKALMDFEREFPEAWTGNLADRLRDKRGLCRYVNTPGGCSQGARQCEYSHSNEDKECKFNLAGEPCGRGHMCAFVHIRPDPPAPEIPPRITIPDPQLEVMKKTPCRYNHSISSAATSQPSAPAAQKHRVEELKSQANAPARGLKSPVVQNVGSSATRPQSSQFNSIQNTPAPGNFPVQTQNQRQMSHGQFLPSVIPMGPSPERFQNFAINGYPASLNQYQNGYQNVMGNCYVNNYSFVPNMTPQVQPQLFSGGPGARKFPYNGMSNQPYLGANGMANNPMGGTQQQPHRFPPYGGHMHGSNANYHGQIGGFQGQNWDYQGQNGGFHAPQQFHQNQQPQGRGYKRNRDQYEPLNDPNSLGGQQAPKRKRQDDRQELIKRATMEIEAGAFRMKIATTDAANLLTRQHNCTINKKKDTEYSNHKSTISNPT
ncbi:hypothetical protein K505DRAFT_340362 [Melanomma pulvis-pyrius CBS 109.77]|uniref:C3H1-type domain-containing protein n=1 Tax=Melanomma pulvis-pyrius CBS 109.77 TaxID=1314802 RepID=A0A6A6X2S7_9PLEO|nr:hypothetical protein K505DRAFT_340362 [Melanomma pulvis-pyrius CBS 109.77]